MVVRPPEDCQAFGENSIFAAWVEYMTFLSLKVLLLIFVAEIGGLKFRDILGYTVNSRPA